MASLIQNIRNLGSSLMSVPSACVRAGWQSTVAIAQGSLQIVAGMASATVSGVKTVASGTVHLVSKGKEAAVAWSVQNYAELFFRLKSVETKIHQDISKGDGVNQVNRNELAERVEEFIDLFQPESEVLHFLTQFCDHLKNPSIQVKKDELEHLEKIFAPHFEKHKSYIASKYAERNYLQAQPGITTATSVKISPAETLSGIESQFDLLKSNAISTVLGTVILNLTMGLWTMDHLGLQELENSLQAMGIDWTTLDIAPPKATTHLVNFLIEVSNKAKIKGKTPEKVFKKLIHSIIDNSGRNIVVRQKAKLSLDTFAPLITRFVGNLIHNMKDTVIKFAKLPPEKQLEQITELFIDPLLAHLTGLEQRPFPQTLDPKTQAIFDKVAKALSKEGPQTPEELLDQFIEIFLNQFIDPIYQPWTRTARTACLEKATSSNPVVKVFFLILAWTLLVTGKLIAPLQWILNETVHFAIKKMIVGLCPSLASATKNSLQIGTTHSWHSLKSNLLTILQQVRLNGLLPRTEDPSYQPAKEIPSAVTTKWNTVLDKLINQLSSSVSSAIVNNNKVKQDYILPGALRSVLGMFAQEGFVNGILLSSLTSTNVSGFAANSVAVPAAEKQRVEIELDKEFGILGKNIIQTVQDSIRTDKSYQSTANVLITTLKQEVKTFQKAVLRLTENPVLFEANVQKLHLDFVQKIEKLRKELNVDAPTQALLIPHLEEALRLAQIISSPENLRKELEFLLNKLSTYLENPLETGEKIELTLAEIKALNPSFFDVQAFEDDFNENMENYLYDIWSKEKPASLEPLKQLIAAYKDKANNNKRIEQQKTEVDAKLTALSKLLKTPLANQEAIKTIVAELKAINPSFLDINAFEADLGRALVDYKARLRGTKSGPRLEPLQTLIHVYKDKAHRQVPIKIKETHIKSTLALTQRFAQWADQLKFVKVTTKPGASDAALALLLSSQVTTDVASAAVQTFGKNLFTFIGDERHLAGIAEKGMKAFLKKCPKQSQAQRRAIIEAPKVVVKPSSKVRPIPIAKHLELAQDNWAIVPSLYHYSFKNY